MPLSHPIPAPPVGCSVAAKGGADRRLGLGSTGTHDGTPHVVYYLRRGSEEGERETGFGLNTSTNLGTMNI